MGKIVPVQLNVIMTNGKSEKRTIYAEEGMTFLYGGKTYQVKNDGKSITMDAKFYATLGGVSQEIRENDPHNNDYYVLTNADISNAYNNRFDTGTLQGHINNAQTRLGTGVSLKTSPETGNATDLTPREGGLTIQLRDNHNHSAGSVSIFKAK